MYPETISLIYDIISLMKSCPYCGEEINSDAKKCKYCHEWLRKNHFISIKKVGIIPIFVMLIITTLGIASASNVIDFPSISTRKIQQEILPSTSPTAPTPTQFATPTLPIQTYIQPTVKTGKITSEISLIPTSVISPSTSLIYLTSQNRSTYCQREGLDAVKSADLSLKEASDRAIDCGENVRSASFRCENECANNYTDFLEQTCLNSSTVDECNQFARGNYDQCTENCRSGVNEEVDRCMIGLEGKANGLFSLLGQYCNE